MKERENILKQMRLAEMDNDNMASNLAAEEKGGKTTASKIVVEA